MATITQTELLQDGTFVSFGDADILDVTGACTFAWYADVTDCVEATAGYIYSKGLSSGTFGPRLQYSETSDNVSLVIPSVSNNLAPNLASSNDTWEITDGWIPWLVTFEGSSTELTGSWYRNGTFDRSATDANDPNLAGNTVEACLFNRSNSHDRSLVGSCAYFAKWNRVLSAAEAATVASDGPLAVPDGLVFCWANGQDYGPSALTPTSRSTFAAGSTPPNTNLGSASTTHDLTAGGMSATPTLASPALGQLGQLVAEGLTVTPGLGFAILEGQTMTFASSGDSISAHPTNSSIDNAGSSAPTVNVEVRVVYSNWRQAYFSVDKAADKRPLFRLTNPEDCSDNTFRSSWRPWFSYDGLTWQRFDTAPYVDGNGYWCFQHSTAFTQDLVYIGYQPAWPVSRVPWLISELQAIDADLVHALPSAPSFEYPSGLNLQWDELGRPVFSQKMYAFGVWDDTLQPLDSSAKRIAVIVSGTHAGEHVGSWAMEGFVRFLFGGSAQATTLLRNFKFFIYPLVNPMGRYMGHYRGQRDTASLTLDPNRDWPEDNSTSVLQSTQFLRSMMAADMGSNDAAFFADFHATWGTATAFYYYNSLDPNADYLTEWDARVKTYSSFNDMDNITATTIAAGFTRTYEPHHCYIPETYESSAFAGGITDVLGVGEVYAKALADTPLSELRLPAITSHDLAASGLSSAPTLGAPVFGQAHGLSAESISTSPELAQPSISQIHALGALAASSQAILGAATLDALPGVIDLEASGLTVQVSLALSGLGQVHVLGGDGCGLAPVLGSAGLIQGHLLAGAGLVSPAALSTVELVETQSADALPEALGVSTSPVFPDVSIGQVHILLPSTLVDAAVLDSPALGQEHALGQGLGLNSQVALDSPDILLVDQLDEALPLLVQPALGGPSLGQAHLLAAPGLSLQTTCGLADVSQIHVLEASALAASQIDMGLPRIVSFEEALLIRLELESHGAIRLDFSSPGVLAVSMSSAGTTTTSLDSGGVRRLVLNSYLNVESNEL